MIQVILRGNTYGIKDTLKKLGFRYSKGHNCWFRNFEDSEEKEARRIADRWTYEGVYGKVEII